MTRWRPRVSPHLFVAALLSCTEVAPIQITGPPELVAKGASVLIHEHIEACLGSRFRPIVPYKKPITKEVQYSRAWGRYRSLRTLGEQNAYCDNMVAEGCPASLTSGYLLLAAPIQYSSAGLPFSDGCQTVQEESPKYGGRSMKGNICLVSRGGCALGSKWKNCMDAGAKAVIIHNMDGSGKFMVGPGEIYSDYGPGLLTVDYGLYEAVAPYFPNVTVNMELNVVIKERELNCTMETLIEARILGNCDKDCHACGYCGKSEVWAKQRNIECQGKLDTQQAADAAEATANGLYSGNLVANQISGERSDDPYSTCILEESCIETWTQIPMYTWTVLILLLLLLLCFVEITAMFCLGTSKTPMKPREARLKFGLPGFSPHFGCCCPLKVCPTFPVFYKKPQEYIWTGMFRYFLYTWPFLPRGSDPQMQFSARLLCTIVCTLVSLMCMMILGNGGVKYEGMRSGSDVEVAGEAYEKMISGNSLASGKLTEGLQMSDTARNVLNMFICITVQEFAKQIMRRWMAKLFEMVSHVSFVCRLHALYSIVLS